MSVQNIKQITITCFFSRYIYQAEKCKMLRPTNYRLLSEAATSSFCNNFCKFFFYFVSNNLIAIKFKNGKEEEKIA